MCDYGRWHQAQRIRHIRKLHDVQPPLSKFEAPYELLMRTKTGS